MKLVTAPPRNVRTRASLLASWGAAKNMADTNGAIVLNHASAAGFLIEQHLVIAIAIALCPTEPWWETVREYLRQVEREEKAAELDEFAAASRELPDFSGGE